MLQITRGFFRSQPTPRPSPSQPTPNPSPPGRGSQESGVVWEWLQYHFLGWKSSFLSKGCLLKIIFIPLTIRNILFSKWYNNNIRQ
ncbi:hypothetical protein [Okeania sp. SIO1H4]|uniref:hypothetical protein n=2 Tax=unclassified Okeania TaxID=2634635 RepID=UPI0013B81CE8|nr:hypothetical protein [Okeania sp. SIO1H4]NET19513.1 hypothetical protein [Okeania sp. SIO1H5]